MGGLKKTVGVVHLYISYDRAEINEKNRSTKLVITNKNRKDDWFK